ncbi:MAG TPA: hypothetical protein VHD15_13325 [Hyphomicrobiales bacterium]|nr:hypothetical protein [Hyphomicrobiales bacterium]
MTEILKPWFRPKRYGYGATPITWEGWAITLGTVAVMIGVSVGLRLTTRNDWALAVLVAFDVAALGVLFAVSRHRTAGVWRWRWGGRDG